MSWVRSECASHRDSSPYICLLPPSSSPSLCSQPTFTPRAAPAPGFLRIRDRGTKDIQIKTPTAQMGKLRPRESRGLPNVTQGANFRTWTSTQAPHLRSCGPSLKAAHPPGASPNPLCPQALPSPPRRAPNPSHCQAQAGARSPSAPCSCPGRRGKSYRTERTRSRAEPRQVPAGPGGRVNGPVRPTPGPLPKAHPSGFPPLGSSGPRAPLPSGHSLPRRAALGPVCGHRDAHQSQAGLPGLTRQPLGTSASARPRSRRPACEERRDRKSVV